MGRIQMIAGAVSMLLTNSVSAGEDAFSRTLRLEEDRTFEFVQLHDLWMDGSAENYLRTVSLVENIIHEENPQFILITGDIVAPTVAAEDYEQQHTAALEYIKERGIPWVWTGGNDHEGLTREQMLNIDTEFGGDLSWTGFKWNVDEAEEAQDIGLFAARIPVMDRAGIAEIFSIYIMDSHADTLCQEDRPGTSCISSAGIEWYMHQQRLFSHHHKRRDFTFTHSPPQEFMNLANFHEIHGHKQQAINCQAANNGFYAAVLQTARTGWIGAGSDYNNDFSGNYHDIWFSNGRKTGYGGPGNLTRGARIFGMEERSNGSVHIGSSVIDDDGSIGKGMQARSPPSFTFSKQKQCGIDPIKKLLGRAGDNVVTDKLDDSGTDVIDTQ